MEQSHRPFANRKGAPGVPFTDTSGYPQRNPVARPCVAQPNYAALGIDDPEGHN